MVKPTVEFDNHAIFAHVNPCWPEFLDCVWDAINSHGLQISVRLVGACRHELAALGKNGLMIARADQVSSFAASPNGAPNEWREKDAHRKHNGRDKTRAADATAPSPSWFQRFAHMFAVIVHRARHPGRKSQVECVQTRIPPLL
jgi:hypothetical protein